MPTLSVDCLEPELGRSESTDEGGSEKRRSVLMSERGRVGGGERCVV